MTRQFLLPGTAALILIAGFVIAQQVTAGAPGRLAAHQIDGKRLYDAHGVLVGRIESATPLVATVRMPDGKQITVAMTALELGHGARTVIVEGEAAKLAAATTRSQD